LSPVPASKEAQLRQRAQFEANIDRLLAGVYRIAFSNGRTRTADGQCYCTANLSIKNPVQVFLADLVACTLIYLFAQEVERTHFYLAYHGKNDRQLQVREMLHLLLGTNSAMQEKIAGLYLNRFVLQVCCFAKRELKDVHLQCTDIDFHGAPLGGRYY
jgi:hypothetical protein